MARARLVAACTTHTIQAHIRRDGCAHSRKDWGRAQGPQSPSAPVITSKHPQLVHIHTAQLPASSPPPRKCTLSSSPRMPPGSQGQGRAGPPYPPVFPRQGAQGKAAAGGGMGGAPAPHLSPSNSPLARTPPRACSHVSGTHACHARWLPRTRTGSSGSAAAVRQDAIRPLPSTRPQARLVCDGSVVAAAVVAVLLLQVRVAREVVGHPDEVAKLGKPGAKEGEGPLVPRTGGTAGRA